MAYVQADKPGLLEGLARVVSRIPVPAGMCGLHGPDAGRPVLGADCKFWLDKNGQISEVSKAVRTGVGVAAAQGLLKEIAATVAGSDGTGGGDLHLGFHIKGVGIGHDLYQDSFQSLRLHLNISLLPFKTGQKESLKSTLVGAVSTALLALMMPQFLLSGAAPPPLLRRMKTGQSIARHKESHHQAVVEIWAGSFADWIVAEQVASDTISSMFHSIAHYLLRKSLC
jgi:hypothetical protein